MSKIKLKESIICLIEHKVSKGYAKCINEALNRVDSKYMVIMDSDVILTSNWQIKVKQSLMDTTIGGVGSVLIYPQTNGIQCAGIAYTETVARHLFLNAKPQTIPSIIYDVQATVFAFFATRWDIVCQVGDLDEHFFNGYEDIDYQMRIRKLGYRIIIDPKLQNYHWEQSNGKFRNYGRRSNLALLWKKHGDYISEDLWKFLFPQINNYIDEAYTYDGIDICSIRNDAQSFWKFTQQLSSIKVDNVYEYWYGISDQENINLSMFLPYDSFRNIHPFLILCDNFIRLLDNNYWVNLRLQYCTKDILADLYGNVMSWHQLKNHFWPGSKIR